MAGCEDYDYDSLEGVDPSGGVLILPGACFYAAFSSSSSVRQVVGEKWPGVFFGLPLHSGYVYAPTPTKGSKSDA